MVKLYNGSNGSHNINTSKNAKNGRKFKKICAMIFLVCGFVLVILGILIVLFFRDMVDSYIKSVSFKIFQKFYLTQHFLCLRVF